MTYFAPARQLVVGINIGCKKHLPWEPWGGPGAQGALRGKKSKKIQKSKKSQNVLKWCPRGPGGPGGYFPLIFGLFWVIFGQFFFPPISPLGALFLGPPISPFWAAALWGVPPAQFLHVAEEQLLLLLCQV